MGQYIDVEVDTAIGRADAIVKLQDTLYVFEFKVDGTPEEALAQINSKEYAIPYQVGDWKIDRRWFGNVSLLYYLTY